MKKNRIVIVIAIIAILVSSIGIPIYAEANNGLAEPGFKNSGSTSDWSDVSSKDWMSCIDGTTTLNNINLPGTHDSGTQYVTKGFYGMAQCQSRSIKEQLDIGVRFLDIRLKNDNNLFGKSLRLVHGTIDCLVSDNAGSKHLTFEHVLEDWVYPFLKAHPDETIVMSIKEQNGKTKSFNDKLLEYINENPDKWITDTEVTTLNEARGKIVLMRRYEMQSGDKKIGLDFSNWESSNLNEMTINSDSKAYVQDKYDGFDFSLDDAVSQKWKSFNDMSTRCENGNYNNKKDFVINFSSATGKGNTPREFAHGRDKSIFHDAVEGIDKKIEKKSWKYGVKYGWVPMDFTGATMAQNIYSSNNYLPYTPTIKYTGVSTDDKNYYFHYDFLDSGKKSDRYVIFEYSLSSGDGVDGTQMMKTGDSPSSYYFTMPKKNFYASHKYYGKLYQVDSGQTVSNEETFTFKTESEVGKYADLQFPEWIDATNPEVTANAIFSLECKTDEIDYSIVDGMDTNSVIVSGKSPNLTSDKFVIGKEYRSKITTKALTSNMTYTSDPVLFSPKKLGAPSYVETVVDSYDSVTVSWNYESGWDYEYFNIYIKNASDNKVVASQKAFSYGDQVEMLGLNPNTKYKAVVEAVGGNLTKQSSPVEFETEDAPTLRLAPPINYLSNGISSITLSTSFSDNSLIEGKRVSYAWKEKNRTKGLDYQLISNANQKNLEYSPLTSDIMEVKSIATIISSDNNSIEQESNRAFVYKAPNEPASVSAENIGLTSLKLIWDISNIDGATGYEIEYDGKKVYAEPENDYINIRGLTPNTEYTFSVSTLGYSVGDKQARSDKVEFTTKTLAEASIPTDVSIKVSPEAISSFDTPITYTASAQSSDGGDLTYQWQITDEDGTFNNIIGATDSYVEIKPSADNLNSKIRCIVTNNLNGTKASATTLEKYIQFKPPIVTDITANPTKRIGAISIDVTWKNPEMFEYYIVSIKKSDSTLSSILGLNESDNNKRYRLVKAEGDEGHLMTISFGDLEPDTSYDIQIENVIKDPLSGKYLPAELKSIKTTNVKTLEGAKEPIIIKNPPETTKAIIGDTATFSMTGRTSSDNNSYYRWYEVYNTLEDGSTDGTTLDYGVTSGIETHDAKVKASKENNGNIYYAQLLSENNGDVIVATSEKTVLDVSEKDKGIIDKDGQDKDKSNSKTGDYTKFAIWIILSLMVVVTLVILLKKRLTQNS